jgi:hypothetical protein
MQPARLASSGARYGPCCRLAFLFSHVYRKRELPWILAGLMAVEEILQRGRHLAQVRAALPQFIGHLLGDIPWKLIASLDGRLD